MSIVFENEWKNAAGQWQAIPHLSTKNESFLRTCQLLKRMNISNYMFPLTLYDPDLADVDVHDLEDNTPENQMLRIKVQIEARRNTWYFLRECIRIYEQGGMPVRFRLDRGSCAMTWCWLNGLDYCGMQPRQTGKLQPLYSKVLTDKGWVTMGDITLSHQAVMPDGSYAAISGIYPQGVHDIYQVTLKDGRSTHCGDEHLWKFYHNDFSNQYKVDIFKTIRLSDKPIFIPVTDEWFAGGLREEVASIEYVGRHESQCIEVDHPDHLYITDDYIITHNTVCALSLIANIMYSTGYEYVVGGVAKDNDLRQENVKRVKAFGDNLPAWWLLKDRYKDKTNAEELYYSEYRTHYQTFVAQKEAAAADKQGRGGSMPMIHFDEFEYIVNIGTTYPTMMSSGSTAKENAKKNGKPYSNIITTTAGDPLTKPCKEAARLLEGAMPFTEQLYDIENNEKLHALVEGRSPQKMILGVFSHLQLGKDNTWLRKRIQTGRLTEDQTKRDFLNRRVSIADKPIIPKHTLALINASQRDPTHIEIMNDKFVIYWYLPKETVNSAEFRMRPIVVGCDSSEMIGRDATTLVGVDPRTLDTLFTFHCTEGNINKLGVMIAQLMMKYPKIVWVPENKSSGTSLIDIVSLILRKEGHNPFSRIFNWIVNNRDTAEFGKYDLRDMTLLDTNLKRYFGIKTDKAKRDELYGEALLDGTERAASRIKDQTLIQELNSLTIRNGRVDHAIGGHDDTCFVGDTLIRTIDGNRPIKELKVGDLVLTRQGYKPILHVFSKEKEVITRYGLTGTSDHPFITPKGIIRFDQLNPDSEVYVWNEKLSCTTVKRIIDIPIRTEHNTVTTSTDTTRTINLPSLYIDRFGKITKVLSRKDIMSTIRTTTSLITLSKTLSVSHQQNTNENIPSPKKSIATTVFAPKNKINLVNGVKKIPKLLDSTLRRMVRKVQDWRTGRKIIQNSLEKCIGPQVEKEQKHEEPKKELVYNLFVADCHEYFVNDVLVHNCVAWLLSVWFLLNAKHLDVYGIKPNTVMTMTGNDREDAARVSEEKQTQIRDRIEALEDARKRQADPSAKRLLDSDIGFLKTLIDRSSIPIPTTADELNRDPRRFTDPVTAHNSRPRADLSQMEQSLNVLLGLNRT